jgi:predicted RNA-binding Zn-ribbon protein involved in translation (DUF1610 family)
VTELCLVMCCETELVLWVALVVGVGVGLAVDVWFTRYARRNGRDGPSLRRASRIPSLFGAGVGVLLVNPANGLMLLALGVPVVAVMLNLYRKFPCPHCGGALILLRNVPNPRQAPYYRCDGCERRFHTHGGRLAEDALT